MYRVIYPETFELLTSETDPNLLSYRISKGDETFVVQATKSDISLFQCFDADFIIKKYKDGVFVFFDNEILAYRDSYYAQNKFVHSEQTLNDFEGSSFETINEYFKLGGTFEIEEFGLTCRVLFQILPFNKEIKTKISLFNDNNERNIKSTELRFNIPALGNFDENLDISFQYIKKRTLLTLKKRLDYITGIRATVYDLKQVIEFSNKIFGTHGAFNQELHNKIFFKANPNRWLNDYYLPSSLVDSNISRNLPAHVSKYDVWNWLGLLEGTAMSLYNLDLYENISKASNSILFETSDFVLGAKDDISSLEDTDTTFLNGLSEKDFAF